MYFLATLSAQFTFLKQAIRIRQVTVGGKIVKLDAPRLFICTHRAQSDDYTPAPLSRAIVRICALSLALFDEAIETVYKAVESRNEADNTYVIFASDNGGM